MTEERWARLAAGGEGSGWGYRTRPAADATNENVGRGVRPTIRVGLECWA